MGGIVKVIEVLEECSWTDVSVCTEYKSARFNHERCWSLKLSAALLTTTVGKQGQLTCA